MNHQTILIDSETMGGTPVFQGTRVPVKALFDYINTGESIKEFLENFPGVTEKQALSVLKIAHKSFFNELVQCEDSI